VKLAKSACYYFFLIRTLTIVVAPGLLFLLTPLVT
jgi:hypothetical protein